MNVVNRKAGYNIFAHSPDENRDKIGAPRFCPLSLSEYLLLKLCAKNPLKYYIQLILLSFEEVIE